MAFLFDFLESGAKKRWSPHMHELFSNAAGRVLLVGAGTGLDFRFFPEGHRITGIDISEKMLKRAQARAENYREKAELTVMDCEGLGFKESSFDVAVTSCSLCSIPDPVCGLKEIRRVLKPGGLLLSFEHVKSRIFPVGLMLEMMNPVSSRVVGSHVNRDTVKNIRLAGFNVIEEKNIYLDVVKAIISRK